VQGERPMAADNKSLGVFILDGIPPAPRGVPQIEVTFDIDANGLLKVTARDKATGRSQHITITAASGLTEEEIERMRREAEAYAEEDRRRKEWVSLCNQADDARYAAEKVLRERGETLPSEMRQRIESYLEQLHQAIQQEDMQTLRAAIRSLLQALPQNTTPSQGIPAQSHIPE
jgi:molecular chaperone DnaK